MCRRLIVAAIAALVLCEPAYSQSMSLAPQAPRRPPEEIERDRQIEQEYNTAKQKIPDKKVSSDPWGSLRSPPSTSTKQHSQ